MNLVKFSRNEVYRRLRFSAFNKHTKELIYSLNAIKYNTVRSVFNETVYRLTNTNEFQFVSLILILMPFDQ